MKPLSIGKCRGIAQCATSRGAIAVLALDHRNNLRRTLHPENPDITSVEEMIAFKQLVTQTVSPSATALLLDPEVGAFQVIASHALPGTVGLITAVEATGYTGDPHSRESRILPGWSMSGARRMGASAIKLLVYYHPDSPKANVIEELVQEVAADCADHDLAFFLEPLTYSPDPTKGKLSDDERRYAVIETARRLTAVGGDVLKIEFPLDFKAITDETLWAEACTELSQASAIPWVLLSASVDYDTYLRQVTVACQQGASGVAVGRAVWKEAPTLSGSERKDFLIHVAAPRMRRITELCDALAKPWMDFYSLPKPGEDYFASY